MSDIRAIVTDIEGTTSSIQFVHKVLFPYAQRQLPAYIKSHGDDPNVQHWLGEAAKEAVITSATPEQIIKQLLAWIEQDRKSTALKALQGMIWKKGFEEGQYQAHLYPEVAAQLHRWHQAKLPIYVSSSGSVQAQQLFFSYSVAGDLSPLLAGYFDTKIGAKRDPKSYRHIASAIGMPPQHILFLSDVLEELDAAKQVGFTTGWLVRPPLPVPAEARHPTYQDFDAIQLTA